jgi:hypothetical protein
VGAAIGLIDRERKLRAITDKETVWCWIFVILAYVAAVLWIIPIAGDVPRTDQVSTETDSE